MTWKKSTEPPPHSPVLHHYAGFQKISPRAAADGVIGSCTGHNTNTSASLPAEQIAVGGLTGSSFGYWLFIKSLRQQGLDCWGNNEPNRN